jgi:hypothetical protein
VKPGAVIARILLAAVALVVVGWLALGLRSAVLTERGRQQILDTFNANAPAPETTRMLARAERDLSAAGLLNPDREPRSLRAKALAGMGDRRRARVLARQGIRDEPDNADILEAARVVGVILMDRRLQAEAIRRMKGLNPPRR